MRSTILGKDTLSIGFGMAMIRGVNGYCPESGRNGLISRRRQLDVRVTRTPSELPDTMPPCQLN